MLLILLKRDRPRLWLLFGLVVGLGLLTKACILTGNYGEAGAIDFFGPEYGLPKAISGHNNYYLWGPGDSTGEVVISVGVPLERLEAVFGEVEQVDAVTCEYCMPDETNLPIYVCIGPRFR